MRKYIAALMILLILCSMLLRAKTVESAPDELETIYILPEGSVSPATPLINKTGGLYLLTGNINATITVQKSDIIFDGKGYALYGNSTPYGPAVSGFIINGVNNVTIMNTRIINYSYGVFLQNTKYNNITNNYFDYNTYAVRLYGDADCNTIANNTMTRGTWGVSVDYSFNNNITIIYNNITHLGSGGVGINLLNSVGNIIQENTMDHNNKGVNLYNCNNSVVSGNIMTYMDQASIHLTESDWNTISGNKINRTQYAAGIVVSASSENTVSGNILWYNEEGIRVESYSTLNTIFGNNLTYNDNGVRLYNHAGNNTFYHNNFVYSINYQVSFLSSDNLYNQWNSTTEGNYWSNYNGTDSNSDGIGDAPHVINADNVDNFPLMQSYIVKNMISVINVTTSKTVTAMGVPLLISVDVENRGDSEASFGVTAYANNLIVGTQIIENMAPKSSKRLTFLWQTAGYPQKTYTISTVVNAISTDLQIINNGMRTNEPVNVMGKGCCIIVAGDRAGDQIAQINYETNYIYKIFQDAGYSNDEIYLMHQPQYNPQDVNDDGINDVDNNSTVANLRWAIESWAKYRVSPNNPLFLILDDHGSNNFFCINDLENLNASNLAAWIDTLENDTDTSVHVIYSACRSGSFINELSRSGRIIITSCLSGQSSYCQPNGFESFFWFFWNSIKSGHSIMTCFNDASAHMITVEQVPLLDDNGDGIGHWACIPNNGDGYLAENTYISRCEWPFPWISQAVAKQSFAWPPSSNITLWAQVQNDTNLLGVSAWMQPPDWSLSASNDTRIVPSFEEFLMTDVDGDGNWTVSVPVANFTGHASGPSNFTFYIVATQKNNETVISNAINVQFTSTGIPLDDTTSPSVMIERPLEESVMYGMIEINGTATDDSCLQKAELYINNNLVDTLNFSSYSLSYFTFNFNTTTIENGATEILLKVFDSTGNTGNQSLTVYVNNFVHDVVITDLTPSSILVNQGEVVNMSVTVANHGAYAETLNVTIYANTTAIASRILLLESGNIELVSFVWNTTGFANGNYTLKAKISPVAGEVDATNNEHVLTVTLLTVIPEFPSALLLSMIMVLSLISVTLAKKTQKSKGSSSKAPLSLS